MKRTFKKIILTSIATSLFFSINEITMPVKNEVLAGKHDGYKSLEELKKEEIKRIEKESPLNWKTECENSPLNSPDSINITLRDIITSWVSYRFLDPSSKYIPRWAAVYKVARENRIIIRNFVFPVKVTLFPIENAESLGSILTHDNARLCSDDLILRYEDAVEKWQLKRRTHSEYQYEQWEHGRWCTLFYPYQTLANWEMPLKS